jgi:hypothetical protein
MTRRLVVVALLVLSAATAWVTRTPPVQAAGATVVEVGWWTATASTTTPEGGFQVGRTPNGDSAVAAFRINVDGEVSKALLVLVEGTGGTFKEGATIDACPTTAAWQPAKGGPIAEAPPADCGAAKAPLTRNPASGTWTADLLPLLSGRSGEVSVVLEPGAVTTVAPPAAPSVPNPAPVPLPTAPQPPPEATIPAVVDPGFTVEFARADLDSAGAEAASSSDATSGSGAFGSGAIVSGDTGSSSSSSSSFAPTFSAVDTFAGSAPLSVNPSPGGLPAATGDVSTQGAGGAGTAASVESGLQPVAAVGQRGTPPPWGRLLFLIPLSIAVGAFGTAIRRTLLGRTGAEATAG